MLAGRTGESLLFNIRTVADGVAALIQRKRSDAGWSQARLSAALISIGLTFDQGAVSDVELGKRKLSYDETAAFQAILDISDDEMARAILVDYNRAQRGVDGRAVKDARATLQQQDRMRKKAGLAR